MYTQYFIFMYEFFYSNNAIYHFIDETIIVHIYWASVQYDILYIFYLLFLFIHLYIQQILKKKKVSLNWIVYRVSMYTYILLIKFYFCNFFFRIQPNLETRKKQLEAWCALVLDYHRQNKSYSVDVTEIQSAPLFCNKKLDRILQTWWNKMN